MCLERWIVMYQPWVFLHGCLLDAKKEIGKRFDNDESRYKDVWEKIYRRWDNKLKTPLHRWLLLEPILLLFK